MHKLDRSSVTAPACLDAYDSRKHKWDDLDGTCKDLVRSALCQMQGKICAGDYVVRCAYCEDRIWRGGHIEHFRRKNHEHHPDLTFDWNNLFRACDSHDHCGHYKDRKGAPAYDADHLVKPDEHDPEQFLYFHSTGEVRPRSGLSADDAHQAAETIRVFGLNEGALPGARKKAIQKLRERLEGDLDELAEWSEEERSEYLLTVIDETQWDPFATTIKHYLLKTD